MIINRDLVFGYNMSELIIFPDRPYCLVDKYRYDMLAAPVSVDNVLYLSLEDLRRIYSPDRSLPDFFPGNIEMDGRTFVPLLEFMEKVIRVNCTRSQNRLIFSNGDVQADRFRNLLWDLQYRGKDWGDLYRVFWCEPLKKLMPYRLYVPTWYTGDEPMKLLCLFHGGGSSTDEPFEATGNRLQQYAEKYGYICLSIDGGVRDSTYGCLLLPEGADVPDIDHTSRENPMHLSEFTIGARKRSEEAVLEVIRLVRSEYSIDPDRIFLFGNSMGGVGTFHIPAAHPGIFRAIAPAGAAPDMKCFDFSPLKGLPILLIAGTEDYHGFDYIRNAYRLCREQGLSIRFLPVAGGRHEDSYKEVLDEIFAFFGEY